MDFKIDDCLYCACLTHFQAKDIPEALTMIEDGEVSCWNCSESDNEQHKRFNVYWRNYCNGQWEIIYKDIFKREDKTQPEEVREG